MSINLLANIKTFLLEIKDEKKPYLFAFFSEFLFIYLFYVSFFNKKGFINHKLATLFVVMNVTKMLFDIPAGILADKFSRRNLIVFGIFAKMIFCILCFVDRGYFSMLLAMSFYGIGNSCIYYHVEAYLYDYLKCKGKEQKYPMFMSKYYAISNLAIVFASLFGSMIYNALKFKGVFAGSICSLAIAMCILYTMTDYRLNSNIQSNTTQEKKTAIFSLTQLFALIKQTIKQPKLVKLIITAVLFDALFIVFIDMNASMMNFIGFNADVVSMVIGLVAFVRIITNVLSGRSVKFLTLSKMHTILLLLMLVSLVLSIQKRELLILVISLYLCIYAFLDMSVKTRMQKRIDSATRATVLSFASVLASALAVFFNSVVAIISKEINYSVAPLCIVLIVICVLLVARNIMLFYRLDSGIRKIIRIIAKK